MENFYIIGLLLVTLALASCTEEAKSLSSISNATRTFPGRWYTPEDLHEFNPEAYLQYGGEIKKSTRVCRVKLSISVVVPGWSISKKSCTIAYNDKPLKSFKNFELLIAEEEFADYLYYFEAGDNMRNCKVPVQGGSDADGKLYYVCSADYFDEAKNSSRILTGKLKAGDDSCLMGYGKEQITSKTFKVLCAFYFEQSRH